MRLNTTKDPTTIVSAYEPTLTASTEETDEFYGKLLATIESISNQNKFSFLVTSMQEWLMIALHALQSLYFLEWER